MGEVAYSGVIGFGDQKLHLFVRRHGGSVKTLQVSNAN